METLWQDIKYGARMLTKSPAFTLVAVLTLALGIGANTAIFSLTDQILLRPLPVPNPHELVVLRSPGPLSGSISSDGDTFASFSYPMFKALRGKSESTDLFGRYKVSMDVAVDGQAERAEGEVVSGNYFAALQVPAAMGRVFSLQDEGATGANPVAVLSFAYWQRRFGGSPAVLNKNVVINATSMTIVGVAAPGFHGVQIGDRTDVFVPISMTPMMIKNWDRWERWNTYWMAILGRIRPGFSREQAQAALAVIYKPLLEENLAQFKNDWSAETRQKFLSKPLELTPGAGGRPILQSDAKDGLVMMTVMVGLVLLIACANVANLLVARGVARQREIAVRLAIGASRWRLMRQLLAESVLLAIAGGVAGLLVAFWTVDALLAALSANLDVQGLTSNIDPRLLAFNMALALVTGLIFGLLPSLQTTRPALAGTLKDQGTGTTGGKSHTRFRKTVVVTQIAMTLLLVGAGLFAKSFYALKRNELGIKPDHILAFSIAPDQSGYTPERTRGLLDQMLPSLRSLPGVTSAASVDIPVLTGNTSQSIFSTDSYQAKDEEYMHAVTNWVSPGYFTTIGIPLIAGRDFTVQDGPASQKVIIVNEFLAKHYYPNGAVGRKFAFGSGSGAKFEYDVIGVVADSKHAQVKEEGRPFAYMPYAQRDDLGSATFYLRTSGEPTALANAVRKEVQRFDGNLPVYGLRTLQNVIERSLFAEQLLMTLTVSFGVLAAALAALGIAGVMAYTVARRTREIGIRIALGAGTGHVHWLVLREVSVMAVFGAAVGLPLAYFLGKAAKSLLFGVKEGDPWIATGALVLMAAVALVSGFLPARRASRIDPMVALRYE